MPSIGDIPDNLKDPDRKLDFIIWLGNLPLDYHTSRSLMSAWASLTGQSFTSAEWDAVG